MSWFKTRKIEEAEIHLTRENLLRRGRILIIDDERPDLIDDLKRARFAVDYEPDITKENLSVIDSQTYDLVILDFGNVGKSFGTNEGLDILKYIKRVNPSIVVLAYTSRSLGTEHAEFFRMADGVLSKDAGITDSQEKIEEALRKALSVPNLWSGMLKSMHIAPGSEKDQEWQNLYMRGLTKPSKLKELRQKIASVAGSEGAQKIATTILEKLIEVGIGAAVGSK
jgi:DNA-binding response OmpR family regulator